MVSATETIRGMFLITGRVDQRLRLRFGPVWMSLMLVSQEKGAWRVSYQKSNARPGGDTAFLLTTQRPEWGLRPHPNLVLSFIRKFTTRRCQ